jgi:VanZ family protein
MSRRIFPALAWTVLVLVLCWIPGRWLGQEAPGGQFDKLAHAGMFVVFSWLWAWAVAPSMRTARILGAGLLLALVTEVGQAVPLIGRDADPRDALADSIGVGVGLGVFRLRRPVPEPSEPASAAK